MILAVNIGNTEITLGCLAGRKLRCKARLATNSAQTSDQYAIQLKSALELYDVQVPELTGCIVSSVVPPVFTTFRAAIAQVTGLQPLVVGPGIKTGLNIRTDSPAQVGSTLIAASVAAVRDYGAPVTVISMGTATTFAVVDRRGTYLGGAIAPGVEISLRALAQRTAQLPAISLEQPRRVIGHSTVEGMCSGIMFGTAAMLDGMLQRIFEEFGEKTPVVATGELARQILPLCKTDIAFDQDLILRGLGDLYENTTGRAV